MPPRPLLAASIALLFAAPLSAQQSKGADPNRGRLPPVPTVQGPLALNVVYPARSDLVSAGDRSFILGSTGTGDARLTINGDTVHVWPNGAFVAWIPFPDDSVMSFKLVAVRPNGARDSLTYLVRRAPRAVRQTTALWIDTLSFRPSGRVWWPAGEYLPLSVRAAEGAQVRLLLPDGTVVPLANSVGYDDVSWGVRAFDRDTASLARSVRADRYVGVVRGRAFGADPGPLLGVETAPGCPVCRRRVAEGGDTLRAVVEAIKGADTVRAAWPLRVALLDSIPMVIEMDDDTAGTGKTDRLTTGRAAPGATYNWFFPKGTRANVSGRLNGDLRLALSATSLAWITAADAHALPAGTPSLSATVGSVSLASAPNSAVLRIPLSARLPYLVTETESAITVRIYGAAADVNWMRYGGADSLVDQMTWAQATADEVTITVELTKPVWGYRTRWDRTDLLLEIKRPPAIKSGHPLEGLRIVVDAGHPPGGATGPTGYREAEANLGVALRLQEMLAEDGAQVIMTRTTDTAVDLSWRPLYADSVDADLLISIHNNALPDGVNPLTNSGTSVFYNQPRSAPLARSTQEELVKRLQLRDLGVGRGDLALVRPTWMPSILTEAMFMAIPEQEAALRTPAGQKLYAEGVYEGIVAYLKDVAKGRGSGDAGR
ncbi:MAG TPA: N-acetylmuramoyl-L-alanine amidase [Gemmatimonadales bacterium]|nr:N-acetylmuramoyl-L-alanine amidase [Gemmatimonadales bacterium]